VLMASAVVVLKRKTSTLRQSQNFLSIDFTFGVGDYVRKVTSSVKFSSDPMRGRNTPWANTLLVMASRRPIYTFQLTDYATVSNEKNIFAVFASDSRR